MKFDTWKVTTIVIQRVGEAGNWYDDAIINEQGWPIIQEKYLKALKEIGGVWRVIRRVAEETIIEGEVKEY